MAALSYSEQLKHPNWQKRRLEVLEGAGFRCVNCGCTDKTLHVHHCYYDRGKMAWQYPDFAFRSLCVDCHERAGRKQLELNVRLAMVSNVDQVSGYVLGAYAYSNPEQTIKVSDYDEASGITDFWGLPDVEEVLLRYLDDNRSDEISGLELFRLVSIHGSTKNHLVHRAKELHP